MAFHGQVLQGGYTRLLVSAPAACLRAAHLALVDSLSFPCNFRYLRLTDRLHGQLPKPESYAAVQIGKERMMEALETYSALLYWDGRNQIWIQGSQQEQIVLDELGMLYVYPDDFSFREVLTGMGWVEAEHESMADRDYVRVNFLAEADAQEQEMMQSLGMIRWEG
jgi:hypothetical protein